MGVCYLIWLLSLFSPLIPIIKADEIVQSVKIKHLHVYSQIQSRFAVTLINSEVVNLANQSQEIFFTAQLPETAFISNFSMKIEDEIIYGNVKEKEKAKQEYTEAVQAGKTAGLVAEKPRETNAFQISVNVKAFGKAEFNLTYQEMLTRTHGVYKHVINLQPQQNIEEMIIDVMVNEQGEITTLKVPQYGEKMGEKTNKDLLKLADQENVKITSLSTSNYSYAYVTFKPTVQNATTPAGQLVLLYDVKRDNSAGQIEVMNGYFVHFFAPSGLAKGTKNVIFVLDKSGSMSGRKFAQTKDAMKTILKELDKNDKFNILMFESEIEVWKPKSIDATAENVQAAIQYVEQQRADGGTNIYGALTTALELLTKGESNPLASMIIFLTDGEATVGEINSDVIVNNITALNENKNFVIHSLAFGNFADFKLVQRISSLNKGLARKVYEDADADLQLTGFYAEIASPLLTNVKINYLNETVSVDSLVQDNSYNLYDGGEMVVVGKLANPEAIDPLFGVQVSAVGSSGPLAFRAESQAIVCPREYVIVEGDILVPCCEVRHCPFPRPAPKPKLQPLLPASSIGGFIERMWAYQTIKKLLKKSELEVDEKEALKKKALDLSLQYQFVTELTSMVVVQPDQENATVLSNTKEKEIRDSGFAHVISDPHYWSYQIRAHGAAGAPGLAGPPATVASMDLAEEDGMALTTPSSPRACIGDISDVMIYWDLASNNNQDCQSQLNFVNLLISYAHKNVCKLAGQLRFAFNIRTIRGAFDIDSVSVCPTIPASFPMIDKAMTTCSTSNTSDQWTNVTFKGFGRLNEMALRAQLIVVVLGERSMSNFNELESTIRELRRQNKTVLLANYFNDKDPSASSRWASLCESQNFYLTQHDMKSVDPFRFNERGIHFTCP